MQLTLVHGHFSMVWTSVHGFGQFSMLWTGLHEWKAIKCPLTVCEFVLRRRVALFLAKSVYEIWICRLRFLTILTTFSDTALRLAARVIGAITTPTPELWIFLYRMYMRYRWCNPPQGQASYIVQVVPRTSCLPAPRAPRAPLS